MWFDRSIETNGWASSIQAIKRLSKTLALPDWRRKRMGSKVQKGQKGRSASKRVRGPFEESWNDRDSNKIVSAKAMNVALEVGKQRNAKKRVKKGQIIKLTNCLRTITNEQANDCDQDPDGEQRKCKNRTKRMKKEEEEEDETEWPTGRLEFEVRQAHTRARGRRWADEVSADGGS